MIDISVIVMGFRDARTIADAVASVLEQADERVEVVVVTSGNDRSADVVSERFPALTLIESPSRLLPGGARNAGVRATRGLLQAVGEYDESVRVGEDTKLGMALERRRLPIWFAPTVCTVQRGPNTVRELLADQFARGRRHARFDPGTATPSTYPTVVGPVVEGAAFVVGAVARAWRTAPGQRPVLIRAVPLMIAGGAARQLGRARARPSRRSPS